MGVYFAPLARVPSPPPSDESALRFALISELSLWIAFALLVFDWLSYLTKETSTVWKSATEVVSCEELPIDRWNQARGGCWQRFKPGKTSISRWFLASRYANSERRRGVGIAGLLSDCADTLLCRKLFSLWLRVRLGE